MTIEILTQNVEKPLLDWEKVERWIVEVAHRLGRPVLLLISFVMTSAF